MLFLFHFAVSDSNPYEPSWGDQDSSDGGADIREDRNMEQRAEESRLVEKRAEDSEQAEATGQFAVTHDFHIRDKRPEPDESEAEQASEVEMRQPGSDDRGLSIRAKRGEFICHPQGICLHHREVHRSNYETCRGKDCGETLHQGIEPQFRRQAEHDAENAN